MPTRIFRSLAGCLIVVGVLSPALSVAQGTLTGTVQGVDGRPKAFAQVQLQASSRYAAVTDLKGNFVIENFAPGATYRIVIRQKDREETQMITISNLSTLLLTVHW